MVGELARDASEEETLDAGEPAVAHHNQIGLLLLCHLQNGFRGVPVAGVGLDRDAFVRDLLDCARQHRLCYVA